MPINLALNYQVSFGSGARTVTKPTDTVEGDFLLAGVYHQSSNAHSPPDGSWSQLYTVQQTYYGTMRVTVYWKRAGASEGANYVFGASSTSSAWVWRITGVIAAGDPLDGSINQSAMNGQTAGTTITCTGTTTGFANSAVIMVCGHTTSTGWTSSPLTIRVSTNRTGSSADLQAVPGVTGSKDMYPGASHYRLGTLFALKAVPEAGAVGIMSSQYRRRGA